MIKDTNVTKSEPVTSEQIESYMNAVGKETVAEICVAITNRLQEACAHVGDVYIELEHKFPEIMAALGFAAIATCNALPIESEHAPVCVVVGSAPGIQHATQPLIEAFNKIQQEVNRDKEITGKVQ